MTPPTRAVSQQTNTLIQPETGEALISVVENQVLDLLSVDEISSAIRSQKNGRGRKTPRSEWRHKMWGMIDMDQLSELTLTGREFAVFGKIAAKVENKVNIAHISQAEICRALGMSSASVSNICKELVRRHILIRIDRDHWEVSPWLYYRGSSADWEAATERAPELVLA
jgi:hypothetical protein